MKKTTLGFCFSLAVSGLGAQTAPMLSNQGALISLKDSSFVSVLGDARNDNNGEFHNSTTIHLTGDWENYATNQAFISLNEGVVRLWGDDQRIGGTSITRFYDLRLEETGVKFADIDVHIGGHLRLNDREFRLGPHRAEVFNTNPLDAVETGLAAVWGFVSAEDQGGLVRHTDRVEDYFYPLGSAQGNPRFRPLFLRPSNAGTYRLRGRMANVDATSEGYDRALRERILCEINPLFYHHVEDIDSTGAVDVEAQALYDAAADGLFDSWAQWQTLLWEKATRGQAGSNAVYNLDLLQTTIDLSNLQNYVFALSTTAPEISLGHNGPELCQSDILELQASGAYQQFDFFGDGLILQSSPDSLYSESLSSYAAPGNYLFWVEGDNGICARSSDTLTLSILPSPQVQASADTLIIEGSVAAIYAWGADLYAWSPDADLSCPLCDRTDARPAAPTEYIVRGENIEGCVGFDTVFVDVRPDAAEVLFIPNVLTPNGDGKNDTWFIRGLELLPSHHIRILNRWGDQVFQSENYRNDWEGDYQGRRLPAGTYYYIIELGEPWGVLKGPLTIIRE